MKKALIILLLLLGLIFTPLTSFAHPGRTDRYGCHTCRTNCPRWDLSYGKYHCHKSKGLPQPKSQQGPKKLDGGAAKPQTTFVPNCTANIYNCPNFLTRQQAQSVYNYCLAQVGRDVHRLDADNDGIACESLP